MRIPVLAPSEVWGVDWDLQRQKERSHLQGKSDYEAMMVMLRKNIKHRSRQVGFRTLEEFAHASNIPKSTLSQILNQRRDPKLSTLLKLAESLETSIGGFFLLPNPTPKDWDEL